MEEELKIIDKFFNFREEKFVDEITEDLEKLENNRINMSRKKINELIQTMNVENNNVKEKILESIDNLIADYDVAIASANKKYYRQGFLDAIYIQKI